MASKDRYITGYCFKVLFLFTSFSLLIKYHTVDFSNHNILLAYINHICLQIEFFLLKIQSDSM